MYYNCMVYYYQLKYMGSLGIVYKNAEKSRNNYKTSAANIPKMIKQLTRQFECDCRKVF